MWLITEGGRGSLSMTSAKDLPLIEKLRIWRRDASSLHQYEAAAFVGDKVLSITSIVVNGILCLLLLDDVSDAFWLANIYFHIQSYARAHALLTKPNYLESSYDCRYLAALCLVYLWLSFLTPGETVKMGGSFGVTG
jgi:Anaphase-promoting complex, cyclosome, subunit 3